MKKIRFHEGVDKSQKNTGFINIILKDTSTVVKGVVKSMQREDIYDIIEHMKNPEALFASLLPRGNFSVYEDAIVLDVRDKGGYPNFEQVLQDVLKDPEFPSNKTEEDLKSYCTSEFLDSLYDDDVSIATDGLDQLYNNNVVILGRGGGYWGLKIDTYEDLKLDEDKLKPFIEDVIKNFWTYWSLEIDIVDKTVDENDVYRAIADYLTKHGIDWGKTEDIEGLFTISSEKEAEFTLFYMDVTAIIKDFESPDRWVKEIIANKYWN